MPPTSEETKKQKGNEADIEAVVLYNVLTNFAAMITARSMALPVCDLITGQWNRLCRLPLPHRRWYAAFIDGSVLATWICLAHLLQNSRLL